MTPSGRSYEARVYATRRTHLQPVTEAVRSTRKHDWTAGIALTLGFVMLVALMGVFA